MEANHRELRERDKIAPESDPEPKKIRRACGLGSHFVFLQLFVFCLLASGELGKKNSEACGWLGSLDFTK